MFEPYLERAVRHLAGCGQPFGIEGEVILPETAAKLRSTHDLRVVFLIRRTATAAVLRDPRGPHPWLQGASPVLATSVAAEVVSWSAQLQPACERLGIPCFEVGDDFDRALGSAADALGVNE
jgi:hypothetical protein